MIWFLPLLAFLLFLPFSVTLDMAAASYLYSPKAAWALWIYRYGVLPGWLLTGAVLLWRKEGVYILLTLLVGSGLICHGIFKETWGRPRPVQTVEFGGHAAYRAVWEPNFSATEKMRSFCSGHSTMGFIFFTVYFIGRARKSRLLAYAGLSIALGLGTALSLTRIAQGGHFLSDTVASGLVMWLTAYWLAKKLLVTREAVNP